MTYSHDTYLSPLTWRYGSAPMRQIWSERHKRLLYRRFWVALARAQQAAGLVTPEQVADLVARQDDIDLARAAEIEAQIQHDLMAEIRVFAEQCPIGGGIIHLGATSTDVLDNVEALRLREALDLLLVALAGLLRSASAGIRRYADVASMADEAILSLAAEIEAERASYPERATRALLNVSVLAREDDRDLICGTYSGVFAAMARAGNFGQLAAAVGQALASLGGEDTEGGAGQEVSDRMLGCLEKSAVLQPTVRALDDESLAPHALTVLRLLPITISELSSSVLPSDSRTAFILSSSVAKRSQSLWSRQINCS